MIWQYFDIDIEVFSVADKQHKKNPLKICQKIAKNLSLLNKGAHHCNECYQRLLSVELSIHKRKKKNEKKIRLHTIILMH